MSTLHSHPLIVESPAVGPSVEVRAELQPELRDELRPEVQTEVRADVWSDVWADVWADESATHAFATQLAQALSCWPGGRDASIALQGDLGTGKTTLVRHLLRAVGVTGRIKSPTYAVVEPHQALAPLAGLADVGSGAGSDAGSGLAAETWPVWHFDFYRFNDPQEWEDAGFRDLFAGPGWKLMEWPDKVAGQLPPPDWVIALQAIDEEQRRVHISAGTARGRSWLQAWQNMGLNTPHNTEPAPKQPHEPTATGASGAR